MKSLKWMKTNPKPLTWPTFFLILHTVERFEEMTGSRPSVWPVAYERFKDRLLAGELVVYRRSGQFTGWNGKARRG
jgi:hypothetical protein